jgi:sortase A
VLKIARRWRLLPERALWIFGLACLAMWGGLRVAAVAGARYEIERFGTLRAAGGLHVVKPDQTLWSPERIAAWGDALVEPAPPPLAVLRIPSIGLEVPVLEGTDHVTLDRGVGHIERTAPPGSDGNSAIAGHRDGFFRGLKDIGPGDAIEIETLGETEVYRVDRMWIVDPTDVSVLDPTPTRSLTLVTCYPFYFVGSAPRRYIVRAVRAEADVVRYAPSR